MCAALYDRGIGMIDFYRISDRGRLRSLWAKPLFSIDAENPESPGRRLCDMFLERTGLYIDPYNDTKLMISHLEVLCGLMKTGVYGEWGEEVRVLENCIEADDSGLIVVGD